MNKTRKRKEITTVVWVNPIVMAIFLVTDTIGNYKLGWERDTTYFIVWFTLFLAVLALVDYYLILRWNRAEKNRAEKQQFSQENNTTNL
ncbi:MAG: hypothetical protein PVI43_03180 [Candidatus Bathyarchaeota archaeon]|jgi:hypothetical protein